MNAGPSAFDRLVRELDSAERRALLVRVQGRAPVFPQALEPAGESAEALPPFLAEEELRSLGPLRRLLLFLRSLLGRRDRVAVLRERYLRRLASAIARRHPGLADFGSRRLGPVLREALADLQGHARMIEAAIGAEDGPRRREFAAFLAREDLAAFQTRLLDETDPQRLLEELHPADERDVRAAMLRRLEELLAALPEPATRRVRADAAALSALGGLASQPFAALLAPFGPPGPPGPPGPATPTERIGEASFGNLRRPLEDLARALAAVAVPPSAQATYDLFLFRYAERFEDPSFDLQEQLLADLTRFRDALEGIRRFRERVPLTALLRCLSGDPGYAPAPAGPRQDWPLLYGEFWRQRLHARFLRFYRERLEDRLRAASREFFAGRELASLESYHSGRFDPAAPVQHELSAAFLRSLAQLSLPPLLRPLRLIYLNGEFYKQENRQAFTDAFAFLSGLESSLARLEARLGPQGDLRAAIQTAKADAASASMRSRRVREVLARADADVRSLADRALEQLQALEQLLGGILRGKPGDRYDSLANLERIGGRENADLRAAWASAVEQAGRARRLLGDILDLEVRQD